MLQISQEIYHKYNLLLNNRNIPKSEHYDFRKWLRYYLDFCKKYNHPESKNESLLLFIKKLLEKHQSSKQQKQAWDAITLYYSLLHPDSKERISDFNQRLPKDDKPSIKQNQSINSVQDNNPEKQVNAFSLKNIGIFGKAKSKIQISHSTFGDFSNTSHNFNDLNINVNEKTSNYKKNVPGKPQHLQSV